MQIAVPLRGLLTKASIYGYPATVPKPCSAGALWLGAAIAAAEGQATLQSLKALIKRQVTPG